MSSKKSAVTPRPVNGTKQIMPEYWKWNRGVTQENFKVWETNYFDSSVLRFCQVNQLPTQTLLLLDNVPGHPAKPSEFITSLDDNVVYVLSNITSLFQPLNQRIT
jgi:hypothetical protein